MKAIHLLTGCLTALLIASTPSLAQTILTGTLTRAGSPYVFSEHVLVPDGDSLVIEPGVRIDLLNSSSFIVQGNLQARGAPGDTIDFVWGNVSIDSADGLNVLDCVRIGFGDSNSYTGNLGCGLYVRHSNVKLKNSHIKSCNITNNLTPVCIGGGAFYTDCSDLAIENVKISSCEAIVGGGICLNNCHNFVLDSVRFGNCRASRIGGAIYLNNCNNISINKVYLSNGEARNGTGGMYSFNSNGSIDSSLFYSSNSIIGSGVQGLEAFFDSSAFSITRSIFHSILLDYYPVRSVIAADHSSTLAFDHSDIISDNNLTAYLIAMLDTYSRVCISNSILWRTGIFGAIDRLTINYSCTSDSIHLPGTGNLIGNPWVDYDTYQLLPFSPCIDAGDPNYPLDPDSTRTDMGAHHYPGGGGIPGYSGPVSGRWTLANSPYHVIGDITIPANDTLIIDPGVVVLYLYNVNFIVDGVLLAGTVQGDTVVFSGEYGEMHFEGNTGESRLIRCNLSDISSIDLGGFPVHFRESRIGAFFNADSSSGNSIVNCSLFGQVRQGSDWLYTDNVVYKYAHGTFEWYLGFIAVRDAEGDFKRNTIDIDLYGYGFHTSCQVYAVGFERCSGEISYNLISVEASGDAPSAAGIYYGSGSAHHNCIRTGYRHNCSGIRYFEGESYNNTIRGFRRGIADITDHSVSNTIIYDCYYGLLNVHLLRYSIVNACDSALVNTGFGPGNIFTNPLLINTWDLSPHSPCIDAGDPDPWYNDPDSTRCDIGARYYHQGFLRNIDITLTPHGVPIQVPVAGGDFTYDFQVLNPCSSRGFFEG